MLDGKSVQDLVSNPPTSAEDLDKDAAQALQTLYKSRPVAEVVSKKAKAILVFPKVLKAGLVFGGSYGEGTLLRGSKVDGYYNSVSGSWGLQAGAQSFGYAVFLMSPSAVSYLGETKGWEIGVGPTAPSPILAAVIFVPDSSKNCSRSRCASASSPPSRRTCCRRSRATPTRLTTSSAS